MNDRIFGSRKSDNRQDYFQHVADKYPVPGSSEEGREDRKTILAFISNKKRLCSRALAYKHNRIFSHICNICFGNKIFCVIRKRISIVKIEVFDFHCTAIFRDSPYGGDGETGAGFGVYFERHRQRAVLRG